MIDAVIPYTLPEVKDHSFFFISQHIAPALEAKIHRHEAWELYYVTCGRGTRMTGDTLMPFSAGDVVLIPPSMAHCWEYEPSSANEDGEVTYLMAAFSHDLIERCLAVFPEVRNRLFGIEFPADALKFGVRSAAEIRRVLTEMTGMDEIERLSCMLRLLPVVFTASDITRIGKPVRIERDVRRMQQVASYVMAHYVHDISLDDVAAHIGMNRSAFCRFFRRNKGITFSRFVTGYRLETACELLKSTQKQVSEICFAVGFNDLPHFTRVFKAAYGVSPVKYRKSPAPPHE